jgi:HEPN domain-containing protein
MGEFRKIHDLKLLAKDAGLPKKYIPFCEEMSLAYVYSRYPDVAEVKEMKEMSEKFMKNAGVILRWIEKKL